MDSELHSRVDLIERMIAEGRSHTERYGWIPVLWGVGHLAALAWSWAATGGAWYGLAWSVLMPVCGLLTGLGSWLVRRRHPPSSSRESIIGAVWGSLWVPCLLIFFLGFRGMRPGQVVAMFCIVYGMPLCAEGAILRRRADFLAAGVWWAGSAAMLIDPRDVVSGWAMAAIALIAEIGFGSYQMIALGSRRAHG